MKKIFILLGIGCFVLFILFPIRNKSVDIKEPDYAILFNDKNRVQLKTAKKLGIKQPLKDRSAANAVKDGLVKAISKNCFAGDLRNFLEKISTFF
ncbi:MAG: hypothetical protein IKJ67_09070 [Bacteroidales bacterium]|nr:hypothetical protein [Bacteroidales bacterium]